MSPADLNAALAGDVERFVKELLPNGKRYGDTWVDGTIIVMLAGPKTGQWVNGDQNGLPLDLIRDVKQFKNAKAKKWALEFTNLKQEPDAPFRCLGHDDDGMHYLSFRTGKIETLKPADHTELKLQCLAQDDYWLNRGFFAEKAGGVDWVSVAKTLFTAQYAIGIYNSDLIRGRGCWLEDNNKTIVYHAGDKLIVNGVETPMKDHNSKYIYPARTPIPVSLADPLSVEEIKPFIELCHLLPWREAHAAWMFGAQVCLMPICGALGWRVSAWMSGPSGSGKSWTQTLIVLPLLGACLNVQSSTTAAGIRQTLGMDALPVLLDELESNTSTAVIRVASVIELVRQASSETGGAIVKGSPSGNPQKFMCRTSFMMSSIAMAHLEPADASRIIKLEFAAPHMMNPQVSAENFKKVEAIQAVTAGDERWCERFRARAILHAAKIRAAVDVFFVAIREACGVARKGQQYGTLAAVWWYMTNESDPNPESAAAWAKTVNWDLLGAGTSIDNDQSHVSSILLQAKADMQDLEGKHFTHSVAELLIMAAYPNPDPTQSCPSGSAYNALMRIGIHYLDGHVDVAYAHPALSNIFRNTQFSERWKDYFMRMKGATSRTFHLISGERRHCRCTRIPWETLMGDDEETTS